MGSSSVIEYPPTDMAMESWSTRVRRVARDLDIAVDVGSYHGKVQVNVEDLEAIAKALRT